MSTDTSTDAAREDRLFAVGNVVVSVAALSLIAWILLLRTPEGDTSSLAFMPAVNAMWNAISSGCLVAGYLAIRRGKRDLHRNLMASAVFSSALFLVGYLVYHYVHGDTRYPGEGLSRTLYLVLLASHVLTSIVAFPMVLATVWFAGRGRFATHKKIARFTLPLWLYVSVTGVVVFLVLRTALG